MAKYNFKKYIGAIALGTAIMAVPGCSDTWDEHYSETNSSTSDKTLWEQIKSDPNLSRFATIAEKANYWKDEKHPVKTYTYADVLKSGQVTTVWAPENDYFTEAEYEKWLEMCETDGYNVQLQLLGNHIALWRHLVNSADIDTMKMINGKNLIFDQSNETMQGIQLNKKNIAAKNGILHTIKGVTPFEYNFYEYLKFGNELTTFGAYTISKDTTYFNSGASIEGLPDEDGNPTYVDSVYHTTNLMFRSSFLPNSNADKWMMAQKGLNASLSAEDSMFIMVMPTDAGWEEAKNKLSSLYVYADAYVNKVKGNDDTNETLDEYEPDSLTKMSMEMDMIAPLVFNVHKQPKIGGQETGTPYTLETFIASKGEEAEYFLNTKYDTLRNTATWDKTSLFEGEPVSFSNGYGYLVDNWNYPAEFYAPDVVIEIGGGSFYNTSNTGYYNVGSGTKSQPFNNNTYSYISEKYGKVSKNNFYILGERGPSSPANVEVRLKGNFNEAYVPNAEVMSGKYDILFVMVPSWYQEISDAGDSELDSIYYDTNYVDSIAQYSKNKFEVRVRYADRTKDKQSSKVTRQFSGLKVDTVTVLEDFEFPYSYKNLRYCYPTLSIKGVCSNSDIKKGYTPRLCIDQIILRSKMRDTEIVDDSNI